jgi:hypothetical protein
MVAIEWGDGRQLAASTWDELFHMVREKAWNGLDEDSFRQEMAKRALRWSGTVIDPWLPARKFFRELERARMLVISGEEVM